MITLKPDLTAESELSFAICSSVRVLCVGSRSVVQVGMTPSGGFHMFLGKNVAYQRDALILATYTNGKEGVEVRYAKIVQSDKFLHERFLKYFRHALETEYPRKKLTPEMLARSLEMEKNAE